MIKKIRTILVLLSLISFSPFSFGQNNIPQYQDPQASSYPCYNCQYYNQNYNAPYLNPQQPYCPTCMANQNYNSNNNSWHSPYSFNANWWMGNQYPQQNYWNYWGPGAYNGWGINTYAYPQYHPQNNPQHNPQNNPHSNDIMFDKPIVYVNAPDGTEITIRLTTFDSGHLTATVPAYPETGWKAKVVNNKLVTTEGTYDYFFYDGRFKDSPLQDQAGFCGIRGDVLGYMEDGLKNRGFQPIEIGDFKTFWSVKLPWNQTLCVFPQTEKEISPLLTISVEPKTAQVTQLEFVVVPEVYFKDANTKERPKFATAPKKEFVFSQPTRSIASKDSIQVRDWGVGFMVIDRKAKAKGKNGKEEL